MRGQLYVRMVCAAVLLVCLPVFGHSQVNIGSMAGVITDPSGAVVPGAQVILEGEGVQAKLEATTNSEGSYTFSDVVLGTYTLRVVHASFKTVVRSGILFNSGSKIRLDVALELGATTENVLVTAEAPLIDERGVGLQTVQDTKTLAKLPVVLSFFKRDPLDYLTTVPGFTSGQGFSNHINGTVGTYSEILIDGAPAEANSGVRGYLRNNAPSTEAVAEFKVANDPSADAGNTGGAVISLVIKSGTNQLHGSAYEYNRNDVFDARSFFAANRGKVRQNQFGFSLGGPVVLPGYDGRNKTFFFVDYAKSIYRQIQGGQITTVPTDDFRIGDFSAILGAQVGVDFLDRPVLAGQIYDPTSTRQVTAGQVDAGTGLTATGSGTVRDPFVGNLIPQGRFSPQSVNYQSFFPTPTSPGQLANNYRADTPSYPVDQMAFTAKVDHVMANDRIAVTYYHTAWNFILAFNILPDILTDFGVDGRHISPVDNNTRVNWAHTFSSNTLNNFTVAVDRDRSPSQPGDPYRNGNSQIGVANLLATCTPSTNIQSGVGGLGIGDCGAGEANTNYRFIDNVTMQRGKHILKFGGNFTRWMLNKPVEANSMGSFGFTSSTTGLPGAFLGQTGHGYATFLLGEVNNASIRAPEYNSNRIFAYGLYVQDEFRVTRKLTFNVGLRWDVQPFPVETHDAFSNFDPTVPNPGAGNIPGALTFVGTGPGTIGRRRLFDTRYSDFGPRVGFAYKLFQNTVIRANYGLYYGPQSQAGAGFVTINRQGYFPSFSFNSLDGFSPIFNWSNGFPLPANLGPSFDPTVANGSGTAFWGENSNRAPRIQQMSFVIQHQLPRQVLFSAAYYGNFAHGVGSGFNLTANQLDYRQVGSLGNLLTADINSPEAINAGIQSPYPGFAGTVAQALRPFPQYQTIDDQGANVGKSAYNGLQFKIQRQFSSGLSFLVGYTISKLMGDQETEAGVFASRPQDVFNRRAERSVSADDAPQQLLFNYTYELPFGPGKRFATSPNIFNRFVLGGWSFAGSHKYQSGQALSFQTNLSLPTVPGGIRPNVTGQAIRTGISCGSFKPGDLYLNVGAFSVPTAFTFGNAPRRIATARSCGTLNENFSLSKAFPIYRESVSFKLGADFFNLFNRHIWGAPATNIQNAGFGTIASTSGGRTIQVFARFDW